MHYDFLKNDIVIVCTNFMKRKVINYTIQEKKLFNIKYMTLNDLIDTLTFKMDNKTLWYVMKHFNLSYQNAKMFLSNLKYLGYENYTDERIKFLEDIKNYCLENNLLESNEF